MGAYVHQTLNQLIFDHVRHVQLECNLLSGYLLHDGSAPREAQALYEISMRLFEDVYQSLLSHWSAGVVDGNYLPAYGSVDNGEGLE